MISAKFLIAAAALALLAGCSPYPRAAWTPAEAPVETQVRWVESKHVVRFTPNDAALSPGERSRLAFLSLARPESPDRVYVLADDSTLETRRATNVRDYLIERRVSQRQIMDGMAGDEGPNALTIVVGRYIVIPPNCPNWSKPSGGDPNNRTSSNWGCATATNLGAMIADPGELVVGKTIDAGDGTVSASSVDRYRKGKIKELPTDGTRSTQDAAK
jgi:pilus assembly protein CpaD